MSHASPVPSLLLSGSYGIISDACHHVNLPVSCPGAKRLASLDSVPAESDQDALTTCPTYTLSLLMDIWYLELGHHALVSWSPSSNDSPINKRSLFVLRAHILVGWLVVFFWYFSWQGCADVAKDTTALLMFAPGVII